MRLANRLAASPIRVAQSACRIIVHARPIRVPLCSFVVSSVFFRLKPSRIFKSHSFSCISRISWLNPPFRPPPSVLKFQPFSVSAFGFWRLVTQ